MENNNENPQGNPPNPFAGMSEEEIHDMVMNSNTKIYSQPEFMSAMQKTVLELREIKKQGKWTPEVADNYMKKMLDELDKQKEM